MQLKYKAFTLCMCALLTFSCAKKDNSFLISKGVYVGGDSFLIYEKGGKHLFSATPSSKDTLKLIETIRIIDPRYKTDKGLGIESTFKDLRDNYTISSIQNGINSVVVFVNEIDAFITIDKGELPANLRYDNNIKIEKVQIPDTAKFKYFMLGW